MSRAPGRGFPIGACHCTLEPRLAVNSPHQQQGRDGRSGTVWNELSTLSQTFFASGSVTMKAESATSRALLVPLTPRGLSSRELAKQEPAALLRGYAEAAGRGLVDYHCGCRLNVFAACWHAGPAIWVRPSSRSQTS